MYTLNDLDYAVAARVSRAWDQLMEYRFVNGGPYTHCYFVFNADGDFVREVGDEFLQLDEHVRMAAERQTGCVIGLSYAGCIAGSYDGKSAEQWFFEEYMCPYFMRVSEGLLAGEVIGPLHGSDELNSFEDFMHEMDCAPEGHDWFAVIEPDDLGILHAKEPWSLLDHLMDETQD